MDLWDPNIVFFPWFLALEAKGMDEKSGSTWYEMITGTHTPHYDQHRFVVYNILISIDSWYIIYTPVIFIYIYIYIYVYDV